MLSGDSAGGGPAFSYRYRPDFDGVRGVFVFAVVGAHCFIEPLYPAGMMAMQSFFLLSGFLITLLLVREWERTQSIRLGRFYVRRALRLLPALLTFLVVAGAVVFATFPPSLRAAHVEATLATLFYVYNWALIYGWIDPRNLMTHCWSLAVEEQFYLVWPPVLLVLLRRRVPPRSILAVIASLIAVSLTIRALVNAAPIQNARILIGTEMQADMFLLGGLLAVAAWGGVLPTRPVTQRLVTWAGALALVLLIWHALYWGESYDVLRRSAAWEAFRLAGLGAAFWALIAVRPKTARAVLESPLLIWLGRRSYGIYIWHSAIVLYILFLSEAHGARWSYPRVALVAVPLTITASALSFRWVETPFLRLKTRFSSEPAAVATALVQTERDPVPLASRAS